MRFLAGRYGPATLALLALALLGSFLVYTEHLVREIRAEAAIHTRMYAVIQRGVLSLSPEAEIEALVSLQAMLVDLGVPIVAVNADGELLAWDNLPFEVDPANPEDLASTLEYARRLSVANAPIVEPGVATIYYGEPPILTWVRWIPWLQVGGSLLLFAIGVGVVRATIRAERERTWAGMARELAHQMGTPLSSLVGWVEVLRLPAAERDRMVELERIGQELERDVERLERVSRRFELIGQPPKLEEIEVTELIRELDEYLRPRLPRLAAGVRLRMRAARTVAPVKANRVLLVWALENLVKNALDALAGHGGTIRVLALQPREQWVRLIVADTGPGVPPAVRERLFEPGFTTKAGGWGVGLSLTRRIVEQLHGGRITSRGRPGGGTIFEIELPAAERRMAEQPGGERVAHTS